MKRCALLPVFATLVLAMFSGCATRTTASGGKETTFLGGAATVATKSYQPADQTSVTVDTTKFSGTSNPSGTKTTLLWGLITLTDY
ncbi:MAG: hypothetical protein HZA31_12685 [Opitutae bacterium]|nr:hypothetical protein [Opitutae bacterium]